MTNNPTDKNPYPNRKTPRYAFHDYSGGAYFVTVCTRGKAHYFGEIIHEEMNNSPIGEFLAREIESIPSHYSYVEVPLWVVMPNHLHMVICIKNHDNLHLPQKRTALSVVLGGLKRSVTLFARRNGLEFGWQGRFHDHIIRDTHDGNNISDYIVHNVARWDADRFNL